MERVYFLGIMDRKGNKQEIEIQELEFKPKKHIELFRIH